MIDYSDRYIVVAGMVAALCLSGGCRRQESGAVPRPPASSSQTEPRDASRTALPITSDANLPPDHPPITPRTEAPPTGEPKPMPEVDISGVELSGERLTLAGINFPLPAGWIREDPGMNPDSPGLSRKAQIRLPKTEGAAEDGEIAITHFPRMKGPQMDAMNLQRWYGMFTQPDGRPTTEVTTKTKFNAGEVTITLVDIPGTMRSGGPMMGGGSTKPNYRMLAAIVDHAKGPHFVKCTGPAEVIEKWKPSFVAFLKGVSLNQ